MAGLGLGPYRVKLNTLGDWRVHPLSIMWNIEIKLELYSTFWRGKPPCLVVSHMNYSMRSRLLTKCLTFDHKVPAKRFFKRCFIVLFYFYQFVNLFTSIETAVLEPFSFDVPCFARGLFNLIQEGTLVLKTIHARHLIIFNEKRKSFWSTLLPTFCKR